MGISRKMIPLLPWIEQQDPYQTILLFFLLFLLIFLYQVWGNKPNLPPSPPKLPLIGNLHQLGSLPHRSLHALSNKHGSLLLLQMGQVPYLLVSSAEMAREVTMTHDLVFASRPSLLGMRKFFYGCRDVGFSPYGEFWKRVRKISVLELLGANMVRSFQLIREEEVSSMIDKIGQSCSMATPVNLSMLLLTLTNNVICRAALGKRYEGGFTKLTREIVTLLGAFCVGDYYPWLRWVDILTGVDAKMESTAKEMNSFLDQVIEDHLVRKRDDNGSSHKDFVYILLQVQKDCVVDVPLTRDDIKAIALDMFNAGTDTTRTSLEWAMAELIKNPTVMKKAQSEVRRVVGKKPKVVEDDVHQMDYLLCVVKEALRLHPPLPLLIPHESTETVEMQGYHIPQGTRVLINAWAIGRDPRSWESPNEFYPDRFIANPVSYKGQDFHFIPFGAGRRSCPGFTFGIVIVELALANLLYWFDWELPDGAQKEELDMTEGCGLAVPKKFPLHVSPINHFP